MSDIGGFIQIWQYSLAGVVFVSDLFCPFCLPSFLRKTQPSAVLLSLLVCLCIYVSVFFSVEWGFKRPPSGFDPGFNPEPIDRPFSPDYGLSSQPEMLLSGRHKSQSSRAPLNCISKWLGQSTPVRCSRASVRQQTNKASELFRHRVALSIHAICSTGCSEPSKCPTRKDKTQKLCVQCIWRLNNIRIRTTIGWPIMLMLASQKSFLLTLSPFSHFCLPHLRKERTTRQIPESVLRRVQSPPSTC